VTATGETGGPAGPAGDPQTSEQKERGREVVIRIRRRRPAAPWRLSSALSWSAVALAGDPILILAPLFLLVALMLGAFALGAPATADALLSLVALPPVDAFLDVGIIELADRGPAGTWVLRTAALAVRAAAFGVLVHLAVQRARGAAPSLSEAARFVRRRFATLAFLELVSFAVFGVTLTLNADLAATRDDGAIGTALLFGAFLLIGPFIAAASEELSVGAAFRRGLRWIRRHPLGHFGLVLVYGVVSNGTFRLASMGEPGVQRALPVTLYAFVSALATMWLLLAFARRCHGLDLEERGGQAG
jgi:hypothetical protein